MRRLPPIATGRIGVGVGEGGRCLIPMSWPPTFTPLATQRTSSLSLVSALQVSLSPVASPCCLRSRWRLSATVAGAPRGERSGSTRATKRASCNPVLPFAFVLGVRGTKGSLISRRVARHAFDCPSWTVGLVAGPYSVDAGQASF